MSPTNASAISGAIREIRRNLRVGARQPSRDYVVFHDFPTAPVPLSDCASSVRVRAAQHMNDPGAMSTLRDGHHRFQVWHPFEVIVAPLSTPLHIDDIVTWTATCPICSSESEIHASLRLYQHLAIPLGRHTCLDGPYLTARPWHAIYDPPTHTTADHTTRSNELH